ncbi:hypothetical protein KA005_29315 [bacterium]|nr:hypothetical protein [bacterium]
MENDKRIGRRAVIGGSALALIMGCLIYIIESFKDSAELLLIGKDLFSNFTSVVLGIAAFVITGLSITDAILKKK